MSSKMRKLKTATRKVAAAHAFMNDETNTRAASGSRVRRRPSQEMGAAATTSHDTILEGQGLEAGAGGQTRGTAGGMGATGEEEEEEDDDGNEEDEATTANMRDERCSYPPSGVLAR